MTLPRATYRVQLHAGFTFDDAAAIVGYLSEVGITHLYCSPYLQARPGSTHGYDVVDHHRMSDELGGSDGHARLVDALARHGMNHILDLVPNHMAIGERVNRWWWDVLRNGATSPYATYFDINWDPPTEKLRWMVHCPVLGDHYGRVLEAGEIKVERDGDDVVLRYFEHVFPVSPTSLDELGGDDIDAFIERANSDAKVLHQLHERQHYRLAYWKTAGQELNYRRFFAINELVALRMENPAVFEHVHELVLGLVRDGKLDGLRIDHIDGLRDPEDYLQRLRAEARTSYIVVEKILEPSESLPTTWPVEGTTGYDYLNVAGGLMIDPDAEAPLTDLYDSITGTSVDLDELTRDKKWWLMDTELATDLERLTDLFVDVCEAYPRHRDYTRSELHDALGETIAAFPVYRSYVRNARFSNQDERVVREGVEIASKRRPELEPELFQLLGDILLMRTPHALDRELALRFQQTSGPVMAKGVEDTLFYAYNRFAALNEVGGDPSRFGVGIDEFHAFNEDRAETWPHAMLASSTHDTKRSEDVRARMALLSEIPSRWRDVVTAWFERNARYRTDDMPDRDMEYLLYQTLVGAWPLSIDRAVAYMAKASKEAKVHTSWIAPNDAYDDALRNLVEQILTDDAFVAELGRFVEMLIDPGYVNSLAQTLLKMTAPGVPDIYQGQELWDFSLVDPDNRRPVDYAQRRALLQKLSNLSAADAWADRSSGSPKLMVLTRALKLRADRRDAFEGSYSPLRARGGAADRVVAFARGSEVVSVVPRLTFGLDSWGTTTIDLPEGSWHDVFTGAARSGSVAVSELLEGFPVALLERVRP
ncbi:MAG: malto-oligosyltrehalose synthase [Actinobacteria bacterium]|nr:malto-oligosyltrehalose synthase [Actinomycetota bacterium]